MHTETTNTLHGVQRIILCSIHHMPTEAGLYVWLAEGAADGSAGTVEDIGTVFRDKAATNVGVMRCTMQCRFNVVRLAWRQHQQRQDAKARCKGTTCLRFRRSRNLSLFRFHFTCGLCMCARHSTVGQPARAAGTHIPLPRRPRNFLRPFLPHRSRCRCPRRPACPLAPRWCVAALAGTRNLHARRPSGWLRFSTNGMCDVIDCCKWT